MIKSRRKDLDLTTEILEKNEFFIECRVSIIIVLNSKTDNLGNFSILAFNESLGSYVGQKKDKMIQDKLSKTLKKYLIG